MMARESITDQLLDCLEQNNAHATFFMLGQNVENWQSEVQRMVDIGCEIGSHSWDHLNLYDLDMDAVAKEFSDTDAALEKACGQKASVARAPYGNWSDDIMLLYRNHSLHGRWILLTGVIWMLTKTIMRL